MPLFQSATMISCLSRLGGHNELKQGMGRTEFGPERGRIVCDYPHFMQENVTA